MEADSYNKWTLRGGLLEADSYKGWTLRGGLLRGSGYGIIVVMCLPEATISLAVLSRTIVVHKTIPAHGLELVRGLELGPHQVKAWN